MPIRTAVRRAGTIAMLALALPAAAAAQSPDTPEARREAVRRHLAAVPIEGMLDDMINTLAGQVPEARRPEFVDLMKKMIAPDTVRAMTLDAMPRHFTVAEIDAMTAFYGSPEGRSIMKKFGPYMGDLMPRIQAEVLRALQRVKEEMRI
jgi:hypothetical protein